jgi:flagellar motor switch protein FliG
MKHVKIKLILMIAAGFAMMAPLQESRAQSTYREESGVLEQIYESRVRSALNNVFRPNEYSVVISVDINQDQKALDALETQMDNMNLPGVAGLVLPENMGMSNKLHGLRNKIAVQLLIDDAVSKEKEEAAKSLIQMRLHMDESAGDLVTISRATLLPKEKLPEPDLLPELSWRMWALVIIVSLLALGLLIFAIQKRKELNLNSKLNTRRAPEVPEEGSVQKNGALNASVRTGHGLELSEEPAAPTTEVDRDLIELYERKKSLVRIAQKFPEAASKSMEEQFEKGHQNHVVAVLDHLGWEESKELFRGMSHRIWSKVGSLMVTLTSKPTTKEILASFEHCQKNVVARYLELAEGDLTNPFSFIAKIPQEDLRNIIQKESPQDLAVICAYLESSEKSSLLEALPEDLQQATLIQLTKIREIDYDKVKKLSEQMKARFKALKESPTRTLGGVSFLVDLLQQLDVQAESNFLHKLSVDNPVEFESLRSVYLVFSDLVHVPSEILSESFSNIDMKILTSSLFHAESDVRFHCLKALPEKRAKMIEKDLSYIKDQPRKVSLSTQRLVRQAVNATLLMEGMTVSQLMSKNTKVQQPIAAA